MSESNTGPHKEDTETNQSVKNIRKRPRADDPTWQRIEALGQAYLGVSKRIAQVIAAAKQRK